MRVSKIAKRCWKLLSDSSTAYGFLPEGALSVYVLPYLWTGGTMIAGLLTGYSVMWVMVAGTATAALTFAAMNQFTAWREVQRVKDKVSFSAVRLSKKLKENGSTEGLALGFQISNSATFPVEFLVEKIETDILGLYPQRKPFVANKYVMPPHGVGWFDDHIITIEKPPVSVASEGNLEFKVLYGRQGSATHLLHKKLRVFVGFDQNGDAVGANWNDLSAALKAEAALTDRG